MIKALFFDMDGTLLTSSQQISEKTKEALKQCREQGIKVFTATARPPLLAGMLNLSEAETALIADGGVFYNGACIWANEQKIYTYLPEAAVRKVIEIIQSYDDVNMAMQLMDELHHFRFALTKDDSRSWGVTSDKIISLEELKHSHVVRIFVFSPWDKLPEVNDKLAEVVGELANVYYINGGGFRSIDICPKAVNKKLAIDRLIDLCGFSHDEVAVFGDDTNDMEMLRGFKHSVAMGNARDEVKRCATHVTRSNDEEGIYYALNHIFKLI